MQAVQGRDHRIPVLMAVRIRSIKGEQHRILFQQDAEGFLLRVVRVVLVGRYGNDHLEHSRIIQRGQHRPLKNYVLSTSPTAQFNGAEV